MNHKAPRWMLTALFTICLTALLITAEDAELAEKAKHDHNCKMVSIHVESDGEHGWPPADNWRQVCADWLQREQQ